jgi:hypothetical protein
MRKIKAVILILILSVLFFAPTVKASGSSSLTLQLGITQGLYCGLYYDDGYDKIWISSNPSVVSVVESNGANCMVETTGIGSCTVLFTTKYLKYEIIDYIYGRPIFGYREYIDSFTYYITVTQTGEMVPGKVDINNISLDNALSMKPGDHYIFRIEVRSTSNKIMRNYNQLLWYSSNPEVATVNQIGVVTALDSGSAVITASTPEGVKDTCIVTVAVPTDYTPISTPQQLSDIRNNLSGKFILTGNIVFSDSDFSAGGAFYNGGSGWQPINGFNGTLDGNGFYIQNLKCKATDAGLLTGLKGIVCNLEIKDSSISGTGSAGAFFATGDSFKLISCKSTQNAVSGKNAGGFGGKIGSFGWYYMCTNTSTVKGSSSAGGIAGDGDNYCSFQLCTNKGEISSDISGYVGGIAGDGGSISDFQYCVNEGAVNGAGYTGGLVGRSTSYSTIYISYNTGKVSGNGTASYVGGIAGRAYTTYISDCYNAGALDMISGDSALMGGIAGNATDISYSAGEYAMLLLNCISNGSMELTGSGLPKVGGIAGTITALQSISGETVAKNDYFLNTLCVGGIAWVQYGRTSDIVSLTAEQMKNSSSFKDLDFYRVWTMKSGDPYPKLIFQDLVTDIVTIGLPGLVKAETLDYSSVKLSWAAANEVSGYEIYRATSSTGIYTSIATTTSTSYTDTGLTTATTYYYKVRAYNTLGETKVYGGYTSIESAIPGPQESEYDVDNNGEITIKDIALIANKYNYKSSDSGWEEKFDFNRDNIIDIFDLVMISNRL